MQLCWTVLKTNSRKVVFTKPLMSHNGIGRGYAESNNHRQKVYEITQFDLKFNGTELL